MIRRLLTGVTVAFAVAVCATGGASAATGSSSAPAQAGFEQITLFKSAIVAHSDGSIDVTETITYDFAGNEHHGIERVIPDRFPYTGKTPHEGNFDRVTPVSNISVSSPSGAPSNVATSESNGNLTIQIGDPNQLISGTQTYEIHYRVRGVYNRFSDHDELDWNVTGNGWTVPIQSTMATITAPVAVTKVACTAGPYGSDFPCTTATSAGPTAQFSESAMGGGSGLTAVVALPRGTITNTAPILDELWSIRRAFLLNAGTIGGGIAVVVLSIGAIAYLLWRNARDRRFVGSSVDAAFGNDTGADAPVPLLDRQVHPVEFVPPDDIRPGHMGTLWDEVANPLDVSAMIIDLAVRGYLRIDELERPTTSVMGRNDGDYEFVQLRQVDESLLGAEKALLNGLFQDGSQVKLSELRTHFAPRLALVEGALYDDAVDAGWFPVRPDRVRAMWHGVGLAALVIGGGLAFLLIKFTRLGVIGALLPLFGLLLLAFGSRFPHRSPKGTALVGRVKGFKQLFDVGEGERQRFAESKDIFSKYLPYAIVFGMAEKWAATFEALGLSPQEMGVGVWYTSPFGYNPIAFGYAMASFSTMTTGSFAAMAPSSAGAISGLSGFGGGGFSGGGFGGGGGGSW